AAPPPSASVSVTTPVSIAVTPLDISRSEEDADRVEFRLRHGCVDPAQLHRHVVQPPRSEATPEVTQPRGEDADDRELDRRSRLIEYEHVVTGVGDPLHAPTHVLGDVIGGDLGE